MTTKIIDMIIDMINDATIDLIVVHF
jgi:hypothetical protein